MHPRRKHLAQEKITTPKNSQSDISRKTLALRKLATMAIEGKSEDKDEVLLSIS